MLPIQYFGWIIIALALLRLKNKAYLKDKWRLAFSMFTGLYSLGELFAYYNIHNFINFCYLLSAASFLIPFLKFDFDKKLDIEKIGDTALILGVGIIVLTS
ncbi:hypothetical protein [Natranaerobius thermophilus]|uniref:Uncharacterized protein n=1 Tax=Natranaerobius thermophilus (strain ATCC BAA-1301 / DSM 18059 / JW/NM-WN-LF) TaxID=457570 RepID=B2A6R1_NATTJ|nr:hypothetical protein [Natranaerobius thermophilus]ACB84194.1 hypothetical protein Nther_0599 [Natranaerobius thermophilus JW/NM-WN-LF]